MHESQLLVNFHMIHYPWGNLFLENILFQTMHIHMFDTQKHAYWHGHKNKLYYCVVW